MTQLFRAFDYVLPLFVMVLPIVILAGYLIYRKRIKFIAHKEAIITTVVDIFYVLSVIGILIITVFPRAIGIHMKSQIQLVPFADISNMLFRSVDISVPIRNIGLNILLFVPFGLLTAWRLPGIKVLQNTLIRGLCFSICIETLQYLLPLGRSTSIDDVILNLLGTLMGGYLYIFISKLLPDKLTKSSFRTLKSSHLVL